MKTAMLAIIRPIVLEWLKQIVLSLACCFFILFGVSLLLSSYGLKNPEWFILTFFSASFIILISAALLAGFIVRIYHLYKGEGKTES